MKKVNGIFEMRVKNSKGKEGIWTIDLKKVCLLLVLLRSGWYCASSESGMPVRRC